MSPSSSRAAIRFVVALFLAQTFVNAVAVPHPHIHKVLDPRQVVSLPVVERQEPDTPNVFDAIIDTLKGYNGWQVFQDFFRKLFNGSSDDNDNESEPPVTVPTPDASEPADIISVIASVISEVATATDPIIIIPTATGVEEPATTDDGIMSILPIWPITTAIELFPTEDPSIPTELISELPSEATDLPEATDIPVVVVVPSVEANSTGAAAPTDAPVVVVIPAVGTNATDATGPTGVPVVVVVPSVDANSTDVGIALPTEILPPIVTAPIVTGPVVIAPIETETPLFPIENATTVASLPGTDVPVVVIIPTGISSPVEVNASVSADVNATVSVTSTVDLTVTLEPTLIGTDVASVGTGLPLTLTEVGPFANETAITPTIILVTGTGDAVGTIAPTIAVDPISAPFANTTDEATAVAPIGTGVIIIGTGVLPSDGTAVTSIEPVETLVLGTGIIGTGVVGTGIIGTGSDEATAVAPVGTDLPTFPNTTAVEIVIEPTIVLGTGTAPAGTISAAPQASELVDPIYANTTTTTIVNVITPILATGVETAAAPAGTIVVVPGPDSNVVLPNITVTVNATADATISLPFVTELPIEVPSILPAPVNITELPIEATEVPSILPAPVNVTDLAPVVPVETEFPAIPVETVTAVGPIIDEPIPTDAPVVEFPGLLALRSICRDPTVRQLTLPILNRFYGPSAYPSLFFFPGCLSANPRQKLQAPGLLNCTALGVEVQTCQASGRRVLLSVKGDSPAAVDGETGFGDPNSDAEPWAGYDAVVRTGNGSVGASGAPTFPNLFDERHVPSAFALTLFSLFGEGKTERADLRPLGPDTPSDDGISWLDRPLGEEVVVDGFDVQVPRDWEGTYQEGRFNALVKRLGELNDEAWTASGGVKGGPGDLGVDGKGVVYQGWNRKRSVQRVVMVGGFEVVVE